MHRLLLFLFRGMAGLDSDLDLDTISLLGSIGIGILFTTYDMIP